MSVENLKGVEVGDRVWNTSFGYGTVAEIDNSEFPVWVDFDSGDSNDFTLEGMEYDYCKEPSLFFEMPEFYKNKEYPKKPRWRAKVGEKYFLVISLGVVNHCIEGGDSYDDKLFSIGNYFKTEEEAKESELYKAFHKHDDNK